MAGLDCGSGSDLGASCGLRTVLGSPGERASFGLMSALGVSPLGAAGWGTVLGGPWGAGPAAEAGDDLF